MKPHEGQGSEGQEEGVREEEEEKIQQTVNEIIQSFLLVWMLLLLL